MVKKALAVLSLSFAALILACASDNSDEKPAFTHEQLDAERQVAIKLVQATRSARQIVAQFPTERWSADSDYENATNDYPIYCPHEWDVTYGTIDSDPNSHVFSWHVDVSTRKMSRHPDSWATDLKFIHDYSPPPSSDDRVNLCWDGKPPAVGYPPPGFEGSNQ